jgi:penicillin-insensitive murein endopeptidase
VGRAAQGRLIEGKRLPDQGEGFLTRDVWKARGNRYGTDELLDLIVGVGRHMALDRGTRLVVADLSPPGGGRSSSLFHRSHQSGRDVDLIYFMRDAAGKPFEADAMHVFDRNGRATDGTGITVDIPRTWLVVKALLTAQEAPVQWIFMYQPIANLMLDYATGLGEPAELIQRARMACRQPNDSARHDDHMHVRIYCAKRDRLNGCVDVGQMDLLAERNGKTSNQLDEIASTLVGASGPLGGTRSFAAPAAHPPAAATREVESFSKLLRTRSDRVYLRRWR